MPSQLLTDTLVRALKPPATGRTEITDTRCRGLVLRVTITGEKSWAFRYRTPAGRSMRFTIGKYPDIGLADARAAADAHRIAVAGGADPATTKRTLRENAEVLSFQHLADSYVKEYALRFKRSGARDDQNLKLHVLPKWKHRPYRDITRRDVADLLEGIYAAGSPIMANRIRALLSKLFGFGVDKGLLDANPASGISRLAEENARDRVLSDDELRLLWRATEGLPPLSRSTGYAIRICLLTGCRAGEAAGMRRDELHDLDAPGKAMWELPPERTKANRRHRLPLSPMAVDVINAALTTTANKSFVFGSSRGEDDPIDGHALSVAMARLAKSLELDEDKPHPLAAEPGAETWRADRPHVHDLRRVVATRMAELGINSDDVRRVLNHSRHDILGKHYDKYDGEAEKRRALTRWADALRAIIEGRARPDNVVQMHGGTR